jgi:hypothetical protein
MKSWPFCAVLVPLVWSGLIILGWPSSCRGFWALLLRAANFFGYWPANSEAKCEECMVVTGWWKDTHGRAKQGRLSSVIWRHSSASLITGLDSLRNFPVVVSQVWRVCYSSLLHPGSVLPYSGGKLNRYWCFIEQNCAGLRKDKVLYRLSRN